MGVEPKVVEELVREGVGINDGLPPAERERSDLATTRLLRFGTRCT